MAINPLKVWAYNNGRLAVTFPDVYDGAYQRWSWNVSPNLGYKQLFHEGELLSSLKLQTQDVRAVGGRNGLRVIINAGDTIPVGWPRLKSRHPDLGKAWVAWTPALENEFFDSMELLYTELVQNEIDAGRRPLLDWIDLPIADGLLNEANHWGDVVAEIGWTAIVERQERFIDRMMTIFGTRCVMNIGGQGPDYAIGIIQYAYNADVIAWRQDNFGHETIGTMYHRLELGGAVWEKRRRSDNTVFVDAARDYDPDQLIYEYLKIDHWVGVDDGLFIFMEVTGAGVKDWPDLNPPISFETMFGPGGEAERIWVNAVGDLDGTLDGQTPSYEPNVDDRLAQFYALHDGEFVEDPSVLQATPTSLDYGEVFLGTNKDLTIILENIGGDGGSFLTVTIPQPGVNTWTVIEGEGTFNLFAGQTHTVKVRFSTLSAGAITGTLEITSTHGDITINLLAVGVEEPVVPPIYDYRARLLAEIKTFNGVFTRVGDSVTIKDREVVISQGILSYPDVRCNEMRLYIQSDDDPDVWLEHSRYECVASQSNNFAFSILDNSEAYIDDNKIELGVLPANPRSITQAQIDIWNAELDHDSNRLIYSEVNQPRLFRAKSVVYTGEGADDRVMGFGSNTQPISEGQFGTHPLYVLNRHSITPMAVLSSGGFSPGEPISTSIGAIGRYAIANAERAVVFVSDEGIFALSPQLEKVSETLEAFYGGFPEVFEDGREPDWASDSLQNQLNSDVALGYFTNRDLNVREVWVSTARGVYAYSLIHGRWFTMKDRKRLQFLSTYFEPKAGFEPPRFLYSVDEAAGLYEESERVEMGGEYNGEWKDGNGIVCTGSLSGCVFYPAPYGASSFEIETSKLTFGEAGYKTRVRRMGIRQRNMVDTLLWSLIEPKALEDCRIDPECADDPADLSAIAVRSGILARGVDPDVWNTGHLKVLSPILSLTGSGSPHQAIESFLFVVRTLYPERLRIDNYQDIGTF